MRITTKGSVNVNDSTQAYETIISEVKRVLVSLGIENAEIDSVEITDYSIYLDGVPSAIWYTATSITKEK